MDEQQGAMPERGLRTPVDDLGSEVRASAALIMLTIAVLVTISFVGVAIS